MEKVPGRRALATVLAVCLLAPIAATATSAAQTLLWSRRYGGARGNDGASSPVELHAILPPGARQLTRDLLWRPVTPGGSVSRGLRLVRAEIVGAPATFTLRATPGVRGVPLHAPLELGDLSSRLRVIDATLEGSTYTLRVEGRRGRSYQVRLLGTGVVSVQGAALVAPPAGAAARPEGALLRIDMPPADASASGAVLKRTDWAMATVTVRLAERRP